MLRPMMQLLVKGQKTFNVALIEMFRHAFFMA
jgi:hypothetical protein